MSTLKFCPHCGQPYEPFTPEQLTAKPRPEYHCRACQKRVFRSLITTATAVIIENDTLLLVLRAIDPQKGRLDLPGGFCDEHEHPEQTVVRECHEELGIAVKVLQLQAVYAPVAYEYQGITQYNCDLFYSCERVDRHQPIQPADDVASFEWFPLNQLPPASEMAFASSQQLLSKLHNQYTQILLNPASNQKTPTSTL